MAFLFNLDCYFMFQEMKTFRIIIFFLAISQISNAQLIYPVAISSNGILTGKYKITPGTCNSIQDTISLETARNLFALDAILIDKKLNSIPERIGDSLHFEFVINDGKKSRRITCNSSAFTDGIRTQLTQIKSGMNIIIEGIIIFINGENRNLTLLNFYVK